MGGLPISIGASLLFKALDLAGVEIGENRCQMIAVLTTNEALINETIDLYGEFNKDDLSILSSFLESKSEMNKTIRRRLRREKINYDFSTLSNIDFAKLIASVEEEEGESFYCRGGRNMRFRGFGKQTKLKIYNQFKRQNNLP